ncbi:LPD1 domain-containing protein [Paenibacillus enshidis]|uniref:LPD1 domain-containing protein n=1 Tax=Paenibacillus enshidis TaxID=1458439 RepID=A0ABV5AW15_9BACL
MTQFTMEMENFNEETSKKRKSFSYDAGEYLHGARKDLSIGVKLDREWLRNAELEDPAVAFKAVRKENLITFDMEELRKAGVDSQTAYAMKLLWARVAPHPEDKPEQRELYLTAIHVLAEKLSLVRSKPDLETVIADIREECRKNLNDNKKWMSLGKRFKSMLYASRRSERSGFTLILSRAYSEEGSNWAWSEFKKVKRNERREAWRRMVPDEVVRLSGLDSGIKKPEDLVEKIRFRGAQFGNWMDDEAGRYHLLCFGNAVTDLAEILGLSRDQISLFELGIAFGARGSGTASAHFEPYSRVINLTKYKGGGSLAHEWGHAIDCYAYAESQRYANGKPGFGSSDDMGSAFPALADAYEELMEKIIEGHGVLKVTVPEDLKISNTYPRLKRYLNKADNNVTEALEAIRCVFKYTSVKLRKIGNYFVHILRKEGVKVDQYFIQTDYSDFFLDAKERGAYWYRPQELFARAFESWIEDLLEAKRMTNTYLVCGTKWGPYPTGEERVRIHAAFEKWWDVLISCLFPSSRKTLLEKKIEELRTEMHTTSLHHELVSPVMIKLSQELDQLLNQYNKFIS